MYSKGSNVVLVKKLLTSPISGFNDGSWHHIVLFFDMTSTIGSKLYFDGISKELKNDGVQNTGTIGTLTYSSYIGTYHGSSSSQYFTGSIDEFGIYTKELIQADVTALYESTSNPYAEGAGVNKSVEKVVKVEQTGTVSLTSVNFQNIVSGSFENLINSNVTSSFTLDVYNAGLDSNSIECRINLEGSYYDSTSLRPTSPGDYGSIYLSTSVFELSSGNYTYNLQCRRSGASSSLQISNGVGIISILSDSITNNSVYYSSIYPIDLSVTSDTFSKLGEFTFVTSNYPSGDNIHRNIVIDGNLQYNYDSSSTITLYASINGTKKGEYSRYGSAGSTGIVGAMMIEDFEDLGSNENITIEIFGKSSTSDGSISGGFNIKEFLVYPEEVGSETIVNESFSSSTYVNLTSFRVENRASVEAEVVIKAGISYYSTTDFARTTFRLRVNDTYGAEMVRDVNAINQEGVAIIQDVFLIGSGNHTVMLEVKTTNDITVQGSDLSAYISGVVPFEEFMFNVTARNVYDNSTIDSFSLINRVGAEFSTAVGFLDVTANDLLENYTITSSNYNDYTVLDHNTSNNLAVDLTPFEPYGLSFITPSDGYTCEEEYLVIYSEMVSPMGWSVSYNILVHNSTGVLILNTTTDSLSYKYNVSALSEGIYTFTVIGTEDVSSRTLTDVAYLEKKDICQATADEYYFTDIVSGYKLKDSYLTVVDSYGSNVGIGYGKNISPTNRSYLVLNHDGTDSATYFDGVDDYVLIPFSNSLNISRSQSLHLWINSSNNTGQHILWSNGQGFVGDSTNSFDVQIRDGKVWLALGDGLNSQSVVGSTLLNEDEWYNLVLTTNDIESCIYINGVVDNCEDTIVNFQTLNYHFSMGVNNNRIGSSDEWWYEGAISDVKLYNRSLEPIEITTWYNGINFNVSNILSTTVTDITVPEGAIVTFEVNDSEYNSVAWYLDSIFQSSSYLWEWFVGVYDYQDYDNRQVILEGETAQGTEIYQWNIYVDDSFPLNPYSISPVSGIFDSYVPITCFVNDSLYWFKNSTFDYQMYYDGQWNDLALNYSKAFYNAYILHVDEQSNVNIRCRSNDGRYYSAWSNITTNINIRHKKNKLELFDVSNKKVKNQGDSTVYNVLCKYDESYDGYNVKSIYIDCDNDGIWDGTKNNYDRNTTADYLSSTCNFVVPGANAVKSGCIIEKYDDDKSWEVPQCSGLSKEQRLCDYSKLYVVNVE